MNISVNSESIRPADLPDCDTIRQIAREAYAMYVPRMDREPFPMLDDYAAHIREGHAYVLENGPHICGYLILLPQQDGMLLDNVAVNPQFQGKGHGRKLVAFAEAQAQRGGFSRIYLYTNEVMVENLQLYTHLGYHETKRIVENGYKRIYLEKHLGELQNI